MKRSLALQKKMTKHYAKKNMLTCAKLKEALMEIKNLKEEKNHDSLGVLAEASQKVPKISVCNTLGAKHKFGASLARKIYIFGFLSSSAV